MVTGIFRAWFSLGDVASAVRLAGYFLLVVVGVLSLERVSRRRRRYDDASPRPFDPVKPGRRARIAMTLVSFTVLSLGLLIPVAQLAAWAIGAATPERLMRLSGSALRSGALAVVSGTACVIVSIIVVHFSRNRKSATTLVATEAVLSGYAIPGAIIVVGILALSQFVERQTTVFLFGSIGLLVYAYVIRYLAITTKPLQASLSKIPATLDDAAVLAGRGRFATFLRVHLPIMRGAVSAGLLVVCIDLLKELPITLVLRPFNFSTLATSAFELAQQDRLPESAIPALTIVIVGMIPAALLAGRSARRQAAMEQADVSRAA
jgi:iron(III) transport system permease protein